MVMVVLFVIMLFACIRYFALFSSLRGSDSPTLWRPNSGRVQFLLVGTLDEMVSCTLLSISSEDQLVYAVSIPPQTLVNNENQTETLADVFTQQGAEQGIIALNGLLAGELPVHQYVVYDVLATAEILQNITEVKIELPEGFQVRHGETDYVFAPGLNRISTANLVPILASDTDMDAARFWAEKSSLVEVFNQLFSMQHISYLVTNLSTISEAYSTDMTSRELARFRDSLQALEWEGLNYLTLPGRWIDVEGQKYWRTEQDLAQLTVRQIKENLPRYDLGELVVDVYNANGIDGFAARTASQLRKQGYPIGRVTNTGQTDKTQIYYHADYQLAALEIAALLGVNADIVQGSYGGTDNPVAVILGRDLSGGN